MKEMCIQKAKAKMKRQCDRRVAKNKIKKAEQKAERELLTQKAKKENRKKFQELLVKGKKPKGEGKKGSEDGGNEGKKDIGGEGSGGKKDTGGDRFVHELEGKCVRVTREQGGEFLYGHEGKVTGTVSEDEVTVYFSKYLAPKTVRVCFLTEVPEKVKKDLCLSFWKLTQLTRKLKKQMLERLRLAEGAEGGCDDIEVVKDKQEEILQQHIEIGYEWLRLCFGFAGEEECHMVDPGLLWSWFSGEPDKDLGVEASQEIREHQEQRAELIKKECKVGKLSLLPIHSRQTCSHWTLLVVDGEKGEKGVRYYETLKSPNQGCLENARKALKLLEIEVELKPWNAVLQTGSTCGFWVVRYMEEEMRHLKEGVRGGAGWPCIKEWRKRLPGLCAHLSVERKQMQEDARKAAKLSKDKKVEEEKLVKQWREGQKLSKAMREQASAAEKSMQHREASAPVFENLSEGARHHIELVRLRAAPLCATCRYQSGCWRCDGEKAERKFLREEFGERALQDHCQPLIN